MLWREIKNENRTQWREKGKGVFQTKCSWETSREARRKLGDNMQEKQARRGPCWDRNKCGEFRDQTGMSDMSRAVAGEGRRVMPLERHESHRMRGAEARLHTPPSRRASSLPEAHLCCPRIKFNSVQSLSRVQLFANPWTATYQASLSITYSQSLLKLISIESVMPSNHLILCHPLLLPIFPSIRVFSNESVFCIRWPKYWSFRFSISPFNEYSVLISFRMD